MCANRIAAVSWTVTLKCQHYIVYDVKGSIDSTKYEKVCFHISLILLNKKSKIKFLWIVWYFKTKWFARNSINFHNCIYNNCWHLPIRRHLFGSHRNIQPLFLVGIVWILFYINIHYKNHFGIKLFLQGVPNKLPLRFQLWMVILKK